MDNRTQKDSNTSSEANRETISAPLLSKSDMFSVQQWQRYIEQEIGFVLPDIQLQWLMNAVDQTAAMHGLTTAQLKDKLPLDSKMRQKLLDKVIIPESRFFRHIPSIQFITEYALRYQLENYHSDNVFRVWSVGCASGQEVWSLAMSLASNQITDYAILGTDVSQKALMEARLGRYDKRQKALIPKDCQQFVQSLQTKNVSRKTDSYESSSTDKGSDAVQSHWQVAATLKPYVSFALHNIFTHTLPTSHLQQVIICQNMLLYFRKFDQRDILARLSAQCAIGGYIILAPGEALFWRPSNMRRMVHPQINAWQKISA